jgi:hypothetical protein
VRERELLGVVGGAARNDQCVLSRATMEEKAQVSEGERGKVGSDGARLKGGRASI